MEDVIVNECIHIKFDQGKFKAVHTSYTDMTRLLTNLNSSQYPRQVIHINHAIYTVYMNGRTLT